MKLKNKVALVTGGGGGLGRAIAKALANEGAKVVICDMNDALLKEVEAEFKNAGQHFLGIKCDISDSAQVAAMFAQTKEHFGGLHILVNNAARTPSAPVDDERRKRLYHMLTNPVKKESLKITSSMSDEEWLKYWAVNVHGLFYCTREALKIMEEQREGKIIHITSIAGISGNSAHSPHYSATKGAVVAFTKSLAMEVAGANIYVNAIAPGGIETPQFIDYIKRATDQETNSLFQLIPMARLGKPEEYASLVVYLASDEHYLTGQIISPNGGSVI